MDQKTIKKIKKIPAPVKSFIHKNAKTTSQLIAMLKFASGWNENQLNQFYSNYPGLNPDLQA
jgi:hypothetical protein